MHHTRRVAELYGVEVQSELYVYVPYMLLKALAAAFQKQKMGGKLGFNLRSGEVTLRQK